MKPDALLVIPVNSIRESKFQIRATDRSSSDYHAFIKSIRSVGLINPIVVRKLPGLALTPKYEIVDGHIRFNACLDLGYQEIACHVLDITDEQLAEARLVGSVKVIKTTNAQFKRMLLHLIKDNPTITLEQMSQKIGADIRWIEAMLGLKKLLLSAKSYVEIGEICLSNGYMLSKLTKPYQKRHLKWAKGMDADSFATMVITVLRARRMK